MTPSGEPSGGAAGRAAAPRLLVVDDEESMLDFLGLLFREEGWSVDTARSVAEARERLSGDYDLVLCDILMPDGNGIDLLREIKAADRHTAVVMMTAYTSTRSAIEAMKAGAFDYVSKPFDVEELKVTCQRALEQAELAEENVYLRRELAGKYTFSNIIGKSVRMQAVFALIERVAKTGSTVLIQGESGTGKELIARALHFASPRADRRFLSINCGAMPENLLESELFGHVRGAFTNAVNSREGRFSLANGGTIFLDEIGDMSPNLQVKLLRVLQEQTYEPVGSSKSETVNVRVIAATNQDLEAAIAARRFREDLFFRLNVIPIEVPPLRHRREDIPLLTLHFLDTMNRERGTKIDSITEAALEALCRYDWPGNVRELENLIERLTVLRGGGELDVDDLPDPIRRAPLAAAASGATPAGELDFRGVVDRFQADLIRDALDRTGGNKKEAAEYLGLNRTTLIEKIKKLGL